jgi:hypothetical protein
MFQKFSNDFGLLYNDDERTPQPSTPMERIAKTAGINLTNLELRLKGTSLALRI